MKKVTVSKEVATRVREALKEVMGSEREGLFPLHLDIVRRVSTLEFSAGDETTYAMLLESICGATDDSQPVEQYNGTLGVTTAFVAAHQAPVGQIQWNNNLATVYTNPGNVSNIRWCSGTLISNDLFLTAGHCFDQTGGGWIRPVSNTTGATITPTEIATNMHVNFNYQVDPSGVLRVEQSFPILALVEYRLGGLDFSIVRLGGNPGATFGRTQVATADAVSGEMLCIIGHPAGWPKRVEAGPCLNVSGTSITYNDIDTLGGNSGSGVLRAADGRIVGVHTNGGCGPSSPGVGSNSGVSIGSIIAQSPTLQALTAPSLKFRDDPITLKFRDDNITLKYTDQPHTLKFTDDPITLKFTDAGGTNPSVDAGVGTTKAIDDVKLAALDKGFSDRKLPGSDSWMRRSGLVDPSLAGASPFVLSTPHHSMAWSSPGYQARAAAVEGAVLAQYEQALVQMEQAMNEYLESLLMLDAEYRQLLGEYEMLMQGRQM